MYIFLSFIYGAALFYLSKYFIYTCLISSLCILSLIAFYKYKSASLKLSYIIFVVIFSTSGFFYAKSFNVVLPSPSELAGSTIEVKGFLKSEKETSSKKGTIFLQNIEVIRASTADGIGLQFRELRAINESSLNKDKIHHFIGRFSRDSYYLNPSSMSNLPIFYISSAEEVGELKSGFFESIRQNLNIFMRQSFSDDSSAFLLSITTGERIFLSSELKNAFNVTGLAHILSISGSHFGLLFVILFGCFRTIFIYLPYKILSRLTIYITPSQIAGILTAPFLLFYLFISDMSIPTIRSFIMILFFLIGLLIGRKGFWLNTVAIAAFIIILIMPNSLTDISFQLSFIAVLCIGIASEMLRQDKQDKLDDEMPATAKKKNIISDFITVVLKYFRYSFAISFAATIGTAPLVAYYFYYFSLISVMTNLIITPFICFIILPFTLLSSLIFLFIDTFPFISLIDKITLFALGLIKDISLWNYVDIKIPAFPLFLIITFYAGIILFLFFKNQKTNRNWISLYLLPLLISILPFIVYACLKAIEPKELTITYLDVGQGDASVIELTDNRLIVIDTGKSGYQASEYLKYRGVRNIDVIVLSHMQSDHSGGIAYLLTNFKVGEIWGNGFRVNIEILEQISYRRLKRGDVIQGEGYVINIFHPYDEFYTHSLKGEENNYSLVLSIKGKKNIFLFSGDIEQEAQEDLSNLKKYIRSTVLKVPHHGSKSSAHEAFYNMVSPEIAIISAGKKNPHGHPHEDTLSILKNSRILRTDIDGAIGLREMPDGELRVKTCREFLFRESKDINDELHNLKRLFTVWT